MPFLRRVQRIVMTPLVLAVLVLCAVVSFNVYAAVTETKSGGAAGEGVTDVVSMKMLLGFYTAVMVSAFGVITFFLQRTLSQFDAAQKNSSEQQVAMNRELNAKIDNAVSEMRRTIDTGLKELRGEIDSVEGEDANKRHDLRNFVQGYAMRTAALEPNVKQHGEDIKALAKDVHNHDSRLVKLETMVQRLPGKT